MSELEQTVINIISKFDLPASIKDQLYEQARTGEFDKNALIDTMMGHLEAAGMVESVITPKQEAVKLARQLTYAEAKKFIESISQAYNQYIQKIDNQNKLLILQNKSLRLDNRITESVQKIFNLTNQKQTLKQQIDQTNILINANSNSWLKRLMNKELIEDLEESVEELEDEVRSINQFIKKERNALDELQAKKKGLETSKAQAAISNKN